MTKPTSRCIDIRQEHPLLDKFKDWFVKFYCKYLLDTARWIWEHKGGILLRKNKSKLLPFITLDQRRERRGKEYYDKDKPFIIIQSIIEKLEDRLRRPWPVTEDMIPIISMQLKDILEDYTITRK
jgi:hypothetical protein